MACNERIHSMLSDYHLGLLSPEEAEEVRRHLAECADCREELEIYFTVDYGIRQLDDDTGAYDIPGALKKSLEQAREHVYCMRVLAVFRYIFGTLSALSLTVTLLLQLRIWWQTGIF